jgi:hypothetical protein
VAEGENEDHDALLSYFTDSNTESTNLVSHIKPV